MDVATLRRAMQPTGISDTVLSNYLPHFIEAMRAAEITTVRRAAAWCSQIGHESAGLRYMAEIQTSHPLWNADRTRYRGRGPIQLTWSGNYRRFGEWCKSKGYVDNSELFVQQPELVEQPRWGFLAASWYWLNGGPRPGRINEYADAGDILAVSRCVNGWVDGKMPNGWDGDDNSRLSRWNRCLAIGNALLSGGSQPPPAYGLPTGTRIAYGSSGFPEWVYQLGKQFNLRASTYPGHQESHRNEAGFAPNHGRLNRGIDWVGPVPDMQRFADYLMTVKGSLEQVIWENPDTRQRAGVAGGRDVTNSGYYNADYPGHRDHVHTRQSAPIPAPGGLKPAPARPEHAELDFWSHKRVGQGMSVRSRPPINFFLHTEEGNGTAESLARFCDGSNGVSYHYTLRDGILCAVVDTDYYSWSVLNANVFSINLCFAGSSANWTREQWLKRERDIEIAAWVAVQDCRKYPTMSTLVIPPPYAGPAQPGISDHNYVTKKLGIGTHWDVGPNFPWDVFLRYVRKYDGTGEPDSMTPEQDRMMREIHACLFNKTKSWSVFANPGEGTKWMLHEKIHSIDGMSHEQYVISRARTGDLDSVNRIVRVARGEGSVDSPELRAWATRLMATIPTDILEAWEAAQ